MRRHLTSVIVALVPLVVSGAGCTGEETTIAADGDTAMTVDTASQVDSGPTEPGPPADDPRWQPDDALGSPGAVTGVRTVGDGRGLVLAITGTSTYDENDPCSAAYRAETTESATEVSIRLLRAAPAPPVAPAPTDPLSCALVGYPRWIEVDLAAPLDDRPLVDEGTRRQLPVTDGSRLAEVTSVPEGWVRTEVGGSTDPATGSDWWVRRWGTEQRRTTDDPCAVPQEPAIALTEGATPRPLLPQSGVQPVSTHDIGGATATYSVHPTGTTATLEWETAGRWFRLETLPWCDDSEAAPPGELVEFARGVRVPAG